jgi:hypothetical protein
MLFGVSLVPLCTNLCVRRRSKAAARHLLRQGGQMTLVDVAIFQCLQRWLVVGDVCVIHPAAVTYAGGSGPDAARRPG